MVRVNLINPKSLSDQHLVAEYDEILMLISYIKKFPNTKDIPQEYCLGKGHMKFFKDKVLYLKARHEEIKKEMKKREFKTNKTISLDGFRKENLTNWKPKKADVEIITKRLSEKLRKKPKFYRYYKEKKKLDFFLTLLNP